MFRLSQFLFRHPYESSIKLKTNRSLHSSHRLDLLTKPQFAALDLSLRDFLSRNSVNESLHVVGEMRRSGIIPSIETLNQLLGLINKSGMSTVAWWMFRDMVTIGPRPMLQTFNEFIFGFCRKGFVRGALAMLGLMQRYGFCLPSVGTCSILVCALCKEGRLEEARELLDRMESENKKGYTIPYNELIHGYAKNGQIEKAREVYMEMESRGVAPDCYTSNILVYGYCKANRMNEALDTFNEMCAKRVIPNNYVYNSLIYGFCRSGLMEQALAVENQMMTNGLVPDIFTINMIIHGYCRVRMLDRAFQKLMEAFDKGMQPDVVTFNTLINAYCKASDMGNVMKFLNIMLLKGIEPDIWTYTILIHVLFCRNSIGQAMKLLDELMLAGLVPNEVTCNVLINGICNEVPDRAIIIMGKLLKIAFVPNTYTVSIILTHFCKQNMPHRALRWEGRLRSVSFILDDITFRILSQAREKQESGDVSTVQCERAMLLEFLMHITYDFLLRKIH